MRRLRNRALVPGTVRNPRDDDQRIQRGVASTGRSAVRNPSRATRHAMMSPPSADVTKDLRPQQRHRQLVPGSTVGPAVSAGTSAPPPSRGPSLYASVKQVIY